MKEEIRKSLYQVIIMVSILTIIIIILILSLNFIGNIYFKDTEWCDYDSCSQESYKWNYNGSACFDSNNLECKEFLILWNVCQDYKNRLGIC